jgi:hypothetical protein
LLAARCSDHSLIAQRITWTSLRKDGFHFFRSISLSPNKMKNAPEGALSGQHGPTA